MRLRRLVVVMLAAVMFSAMALPVASAKVRLDNEGQTPYYARIESDDVMADGDTAMVYFYRPVACVPDDFNLLDFFDIPGAFSCNPPTTDGYFTWENGPEIDAIPILVELRGLGAVPVWFVDAGQYVAAIGDGVLTIGELEGLNPRKGVATELVEVLEPNVQLTVRMNGVLDDGSRFSAYHDVTLDYSITRIRIR